MKKQIQFVLLVFLVSLFTTNLFGQVLAVGSSHSPGQDVKMESKQPLKKALSDLEKQYRVSILTNQELVENQLVDQIDSQEDISVALDKLLKTPGLDYKKVSDDFYVIVAKNNEKAYNNSLSASLSQDGISIDLFNSTLSQQFC